MKLTKERKEQIIAEFGGTAANTGAAEVQVAIFTERINYLTSHVQTHKKDHHTRRGLINLVNKRRKLLDYIRRNDQKKYQELLQRLELRK